MNISLKNKPSGAAVMLTMLSLLFLSSLVVVSTVSTIKSNSIVAKNQINNEQAFEAAQAGLEYGTAYLKKNYRDILQDKQENNGMGDGFIDAYLSSLLNAFNNSNNTSYDVNYSNVEANNYDIIEITSKGSSDNKEINLVMYEKIAKIPFSSKTPDASLISLGNINLGGNASIENTVNDKTISSGGSINFSGSASTKASNNISSNKNNANIDINENNPQYASLSKNEFFYKFFGTNKTQAQANANTTFTYTSNKNIGDILNSDIYNGTSVWINQTSGVASLSGNSTIGSASSPIFLVINGDFKANGNAELYGIIYITKDWNNSGGGNLTVHGAIIVEGDMSGTGTPNIKYDLDLINKTMSTASFTKVPGSWHDF